MNENRKRSGCSTVIVCAGLLLCVGVAAKEPPPLPERTTLPRAPAAPAAPPNEPSGQSADSSEGRRAKPIDPLILEIHFEDDSRLKVKIADPYVDIETRYGGLRVPAEAIRRIELARRLTPEVLAQIEKSVADLASDSPATAKAAADALLAIGEPACSAVLNASRTPQWELMRRATDLLDKMQERHGDAPIELRENDVVVTAKCRIVGKIHAPTLGVHTEQFGRLDLKLADARTLQSLAFAAPAEEDDDPLPKEVLPDPGTLSNYAQFIGQTYLFKVTGAAGGSVWGTDVYTSDSSLAAVAVHAGVLKMGETGVVLVKIVSPPGSFAGSTRHGITTSDYGPYSGAYEVKVPKKKFRVKK
jgi:hypothetical protein